MHLHIIFSIIMIIVKKLMMMVMVMVMMIMMMIKFSCCKSNSVWFWVGKLLKAQGKGRGGWERLFHLFQSFIFIYLLSYLFIYSTLFHLSLLKFFMLLTLVGYLIVTINILKQFSFFFFFSLPQYLQCIIHFHLFSRPNGGFHCHRYQK